MGFTATMRDRATIAIQINRHTRGMRRQIQVICTRSAINGVVTFTGQEDVTTRAALQGF